MSFGGLSTGLGQGAFHLYHRPDLARERIPHQTRQLVTIAALAVLERSDELRMHILGALNVGCSPEEITEVIFQMFPYAGMPVVNPALRVLRSVWKKRNWPPKTKFPGLVSKARAAQESFRLSREILSGHQRQVGRRQGRYQDARNASSRFPRPDKPNKQRKPPRRAI
jgi:hypothetical protein